MKRATRNYWPGLLIAPLCLGVLGQPSFAKTRKARAPDPVAAQASVPALSPDSASTTQTSATTRFISNAPKKIAVTVYRDNLALVTETREIDLPGGSVRVEFADVLSTALPQSAVITGLEGLESERNFDFDRLTPASLFARSIGDVVDVSVTDRKTGKVNTEKARIASSENGPILQFADHIEALNCSGLPERVSFARIPDNLRAKPTLSTALGPQTPKGKRVIILSYLATRLEWQADYVLNLDPDGEHAHLLGWLTLKNSAEQGFQQARVAAVAGDLARVANIRPDALTQALSSQRLCWPQGSTSTGIWIGSFDRNVRRSQLFADEAGMRIFATTAPPPPPPPPPAPGVELAAAKLAVREELGDYQLYQLADATSLQAFQRKQAAFLSQDKAQYRKIHQYRVPAYVQSEPGRVDPTDILFRFQNETKDGLGEALPRGLVRFFAPTPDGTLFLGNANAERDTPVGVKWELNTGRSSKVTVASVLLEDETRDLPKSTRQAYARRWEMTLRNASQADASVEIKQPVLGAGFMITDSSVDWPIEDGEATAKVALPAGQEKILRFTVQFEDAG